VSQPLRAPLEIGFDYTRSLGPVLSRFISALADRRILAARGSDGRVHAPPFEYDPVTAEPAGELTEAGPGGTVVSWTWAARPLEGQPLDHPFAWALIRLDGADTAMLHAVDAGTPAAMRTGLRVRPRWAASPAGHIRDLACFEPGEALAAAPDGAAAGGPAAGPGQRLPGPAGPGSEVTMMTTPVRLHYEHTTAPGETSYLHALAEGRLLGQRCPACGKVYIPPRGACPVDGIPTGEEVELPGTGTVTTFCIVNVARPGQRLPSPYVAAAVLLDGADIAFQHLILGCEPGHVRMGMRVSAVWKPRDEWGTTPENISHFTPADEPDAPYESYARHL
jgi:hypothetical protein